MGVIGGLIKWGFRLGMLVLVLTMGAVQYLSITNLKTYGDGRALDGPVDAVLVLGGGIDGDGVVGYSSRRRVLAAVRLLQDGKARSIIFSAGPDLRHKDYTGAVLMRDHALTLGAPPESLIIEPTSNSTFENICFGLDLAQEMGFARVAVLTDAFHLERARWLAEYFGHPEVQIVAAGGLAYDGIANRVWAILREALAWWYNLYKVGGWEILAAAGMDTDARRELIR